MKYFGTDGIRGVVGEKLNSALLNKIAKAIILFYYKHKLNKVILVGNDSRLSSDYILASIGKVLVRFGIEVHNLGVCSSPALAYIAKKYNYPLSMMISASHNPQEYNGIKFFNSFGEKLSEQSELEIEYYMDKRINKKVSYAKILDYSFLINDYIRYAKKLKKYSIPCLFDCANGGVSKICKRVFINSVKINCHPNGQNININAGCTNIEFLRLMCIKKHMLGFAFDGDADRLIAVSETGNIIDGDKILYILSNHFLREGDKIVGTIYSNTGLEKSATARGIKFIRAGVGDKNVNLEMHKNAAILGGENSGHIIFKPYSSTGDGLINAIILLNIIGTTKLSLDALIEGYNEYFQIMENVKLTSAFNMDENLQNLIKYYSRQGTRIIVRPSGTEPVLRIMVEDKIKENAQKILKIIKNYIKNM